VQHGVICRFLLLPQRESQKRNSAGSLDRFSACERLQRTRKKKNSGASLPRTSFSVQFLLPPVSFHHHPSAMAMNPVMGHPHGMWARRCYPHASVPYVAVAVPGVIARLPHPSSMRGRTIVLHDRRRWANANVNLGIRNRGKHCERKQSCKCNLLHSRKLLHRELFYRSTAKLSGSLLILNLKRLQKLRCRHFSQTHLDEQ
jgi:hypothetical protein